MNHWRGTAKRVVDGVLAALLVAPVVELGQVVELEDELVVVGPDLEARAEIDVALEAFERRRRVEPAHGGGFGGSDWPGAATPPEVDGLMGDGGSTGAVARRRCLAARSPGHRSPVPAASAWTSG